VTRGARPARAARSALLATLLGAAACGGGKATGAGATATPGAGSRATRLTGQGRPPLEAVVREGDARGAVAVAVMMEDVAPQQGAVPAVALAALVEARLGARGVDATAVGGWGGWRLRALVGSAADAARVVDGVREAMLAPVAPDEPAMAAVTRRVAALARRPLPDRARVDEAECTGEAFGTGSDAPPGAAEVEAWRRAALGVGHVAFATAGDATLADAAADALARGPVWPATPPAHAAEPPGETRAVVYDASGELPPGAARVIVTARTPTPEQSVAAAPALGDARGPLASRLAALDAPAHVRSVVATAHAAGGCVAVTIDLAARDLSADVASRVATAAALAQQEVAVEVADTTASPDLGRELATRAADPRDAAERAAWWALAGPGAPRTGGPHTALTVGMAAPRDATAAGATPAGDVLRAEIDRATLAWHAPAVETRTHVERGQGEAWVLLASTCGTLAETTSDAGAGAVAAMAAAAQASASSGAGDARVEPFVATDGLGVLAHGPAHPGESAQAHSRRLADLAARAFAADPLDPARVGQARVSLLVRAGAVESRVLGTLGAALAPGHPSWLEPFGTTFGLASSTDEAIATRASSLRAGPLRVAVLANTDAAQADAAARAVDRWIARRPGETRACPPLAALSTPRPGTYSVSIPAGAPSEALLAVPFASGDDGARMAATWLAAALDGPGGLLAQALSGGAAPDTALAKSWSAAVVGLPRSPSLAIRVVAAEPSLDAAVAQTRSLLDRLRQGALREADRARAAASLGHDALALALDPRRRVIELWRGETATPPPSLDAMNAFATTTLRDDGLVIVAARPPRLDASGRPFSSREREPASRTPRSPK
jgi:hypothetical protein